MDRGEMDVSAQVVYTVAEALGEDPTELPQLEETISSDALNDLFHKENHPPGTYIAFPYSGVWVIIHSNRTIDVFKEHAATSALEDFPDTVENLRTDEPMVVLHAENDRHTFSEDELEMIHEIVKEAENGTEAWENTLSYAEQR